MFTTSETTTAPTTAQAAVVPDRDEPGQHGAGKEEQAEHERSWRPVRPRRAQKFGRFTPGMFQISAWAYCAVCSRAL